MRFRPEFPSGGTRRALPRGRSEAPPENVSAERHRPSRAEGSAITISAHAPCTPAPRNRTETILNRSNMQIRLYPPRTRGQKSMAQFFSSISFSPPPARGRRHEGKRRCAMAKSPAPREQRTSAFPPPIVAPRQLRANKQYANIARHKRAALFHTAGQEFRIHTPTPALRRAAQCRRRTSAAIFSIATSARRPAQPDGNTKAA